MASPRPRTSWMIASGPTTVGLGGPNWVSYQYELVRGRERRWIVVLITRSAERGVNLAPELQRAVETQGRSIVEMSAWMEAPPREIRVNTGFTRPPLTHLRDPETVRDDPPDGPEP